MSIGRSRRLVLSATQVLLLSTSLVPALAQDVIEHRRTLQTQTTTIPPHTNGSNGSSLTVEATRSNPETLPPTIFHEKYQKRLNNLHEQLTNGVAKAWITAAEADKLRKEHARIVALENKVFQRGFLKEEANDLEKQVTAFTALVSTTLSKPKATPVVAKPAAVTPKKK